MCVQREWRDGDTRARASLVEGLDALLQKQLDPD
jgi:hypothetical protein